MATNAYSTHSLVFQQDIGEKCDFQSYNSDLCGSVSALRFPAVCSLTPLKATILVKSTAQQEAAKSFRGGESSCLLQMTVQGD